MRSAVLFAAFIALASLALPLGCATRQPTTRTAMPDESLPEGVIADPEFIRQYAETYRFRLGRPAAIKPTPTGDAVFFLRSAPRDQTRDLFVFDVANAQTSRLLSADDLLGGAPERLTAEERALRERQRMTARGIARFDLSNDASRLLVQLSNTLHVADLDGPRLFGVHEYAIEEGVPYDPQISPDAQRIAYVIEGDVWMLNLADARPTRVTDSATDLIQNGVAEFVAQEEMGRHRGFWWSPDSARLLVQQTDHTGVEVAHISDPFDPTKPPAEWPYPRAGTQNAAVSLSIIDVNTPGFERVLIEWDRERYPYLATVKWTKDGPLTIAVQNRRQTEMALYAVDEYSGELRELLVERDDAWINLDQQMPRWIDSGAAFLWTTEREGAWTLELRDASGAIIHRLTDPDFMYRSLASVDEPNREIVVRASPNDPTQAHLFRISLDDAKLPPAQLTRRPGVHDAVYSEDANIYVHSLQSLDAEQSHTVRTAATGQVIGRLDHIAEEPPFVVDAEFLSVGRNPSFNAVVVRPRNFDRERSYPVILSVYAGPHRQMVMKDPSDYVLSQWFADHGYIVVAIDGRGTPTRGRAWERVIKNDLISIPLRDQIDALKKVAARVPQMDLSRVGVWGWSFGGYFTAHAVAQRPDVFTVGVAGAPVADWRDYDTHYTERYMDLPESNPEGYRAADVLTHIEALERPLLVIHGTADDNVYLVNSLKLLDAAFRADKDIRFIPLGGFTHMVADPDVMERLYDEILEFLGAHLAPYRELDAAE